MTAATITLIVVTATVVGIDILFAVRKQETISESVWRLNVRHPIIPFAFGMLMGHFFWRA